MSTAVAIVTGSTVPHPDLDEASLLAALRARGYDARPVAWDDPSVAWDRFACAIVRSTWNYENDRAGFVAWCRRAAEVTRLANPAPVLEWNTDKRYLIDLERAGIPVVPARYTPPGRPWRLPDVDEFVVKPTVGGAHEKWEGSREPMEGSPPARLWKGSTRPGAPS